MAQQSLFWGFEVKPGHPVPFVPPPEDANLHLSQASLSVRAAPGQKAALKCKVRGGGGLSAAASSRCPLWEVLLALPACTA